MTIVPPASTVTPSPSPKAVAASAGVVGMTTSSTPPLMIPILSEPDSGCQTSSRRWRPVPDTQRFDYVGDPPLPWLQERVRLDAHVLRGEAVDVCECRVSFDRLDDAALDRHVRVRM